MTNTKDFRRYSYQSDPVYAVEAFNQSRSSAAPQLEPERKRKKLTVSPNTRAKSRAQLKAEQKLAFRKVVAIVATVSIVAGMFMAVIYTYSVKNELTREIASLESDIEIAESQSISLNAEFESMFSISQIDTYAVEELGMVKLDSSKINYIDSEEYKAERQAELAESEADSAD